MIKQNIPIYLAILIGIIFGNILFSSYKEESVMDSLGNVYLLQYGAYINEETFNENLKKLDKDMYFTKKDKDTFYIYLGVTTNYDNATRFKKIFDEQNIFIYIKNDYYDTDIADKIRFYDELIMESDDSKSIEYLKKIITLVKI